MHHIKNIHFIGIGGSGMSGIAEVLLNQGYIVSGSDKNDSDVLTHLRELGAQVTVGHEAKNVATADAVVVSSAIAKDNPELKAAQARRIPILPRAQMLAELMRFHHGVAVAGTHGKTTTTSLIASVLAEGGLDPTFVIGGLLNRTSSHGYFGDTPYFIVEADESDASFLYLNPVLSVITNIDADHMDHYDHDINKLKMTFIDFIHRLPFYGTAVMCVDDAGVQEILPQLSRAVLTYGFSDNADVQGFDYQQIGWRSHFKVKRKRVAKSPILEVNLNLPGKHSALNALAAIAVTTKFSIDDEAILSALQNFRGTGRRMQSHGTLLLPKGKAILIDDYGHHPREIAVTLEALRNAWPQHRLVHVFQPHRYTRTQELFDEFVKVLSVSDVLLLCDIYPAGEQPIAGVSSEALLEKIREHSKKEPILVRDLKSLPEIVAEVCKDNDILLLQGAGSIGKAPAQLVAHFPHISDTSDAK